MPDGGLWKWCGPIRCCALSDLIADVDRFPLHAGVVADRRVFEALALGNHRLCAVRKITLDAAILGFGQGAGRAGQSSDHVWRGGFSATIVVYSGSSALRLMWAALAETEPVLTRLRHC